MIFFLYITDLVEKKQKLAKEGKLEKKRKKEVEEAATGTLQPKALPPNKVLFVENLPEQANDLMLQMLFQQYVSSFIAC